ncbi:expressed unknown protein [Seminavis robusta]|uniref:Uncharacterized protein n=1 Tax=Seminavis robusta TaxID=568900 RepID=A0A9N8EZH8_9STRA|nr:expressed unknown protein [Seminavis robusta]|eukprot:Sro2019_g311340.1 n/a (288) ;mRNA; f:14431-15294
MATQQQEQRKRKRVCLFGTSANPPTGDQGHLGIVKAIAGLKLQNEEESAFDEIRVVPVYSHPFASKRKLLAPFDHRVQMCHVSLQGIPIVTISPAEQDIYQEKLEQQQLLLKGESAENSISIGTADLLEYYNRQDDIPTDYTLCLGADTFLDFTGGKWRRTQDILDLIQGRFVVLFRQEDTTYSGKQEPNQQQQLEQAVAKLEGTYGSGSIRLLQVPTLGAVSSTLVRKLSREMSQSEDSTGNTNAQKLTEQNQQQQIAELQLREIVDSRVLEYMKEHGLYGFQNDA